MRVLGMLWMALVVATGAAAADEEAFVRWTERFRHGEPPFQASSIASAQEAGALPSFRVIPERPGRGLVRASLPFPPGALPASGAAVTVRVGDDEIPVDLRPLTRYPGSPDSIRRALVTFPYAFPGTDPCTFTLALSAGNGPAAPPPQSAEEADGGAHFTVGDLEIRLRPEEVAAFDLQGRPLWRALVLGPRGSRVHVETVERGRHFAWVRLLDAGSEWARIVEVKADSLGTVALQVHLQRLLPGDAAVPELGWRIAGLPLPETVRHRFADGRAFSVPADPWSVDFPQAPWDRRGAVEGTAGHGPSELRFLRAAEGEEVPFQQGAWRRAAVVIRRRDAPAWNRLLEPDLPVHVDPRHFEAAYQMGLEPDLSSWPALEQVRRYTLEAVKGSALTGDDAGNVTAYHAGQPAAVFGMNRLNHGPAIFEESWRTGDRALRDVAVAWCDNMHDLSIWWGDDDQFGGTRYNNAVAAGEPTHQGDTAFMWRTNWASSFCTKGYDAFYLAYEETGDPRHLAALRAQVDYARRHVHALPETTRNIGDVADFLRLHRLTGVEDYRGEALRLFGELRQTLSTGDLFTESGKPIDPDPPFIDDDKQGYAHPFAKPYILGYALAGLPGLLRAFPDEPKLRDTVRAVADFMAANQDPTGGWRYPHPASTRVLLNQSMEHAMQIARAAEALEAGGEDVGALIDAVERTLQSRVAGFRRSGTILSGLQGWESIPGALPEGRTVLDLYARPADRNPARDYSEGAVSVGSAPPEGLVYTGEVLGFYLRRRPADRLFNPNPALTAVVDRVPLRDLASP